MIDLITIYTALFICGVYVLSFTIVTVFALYFAYRDSADRKLYKSKVMQDKQTFMSGLPKPTRPAPPMPKCRPPAPPYPPPRDVRGRSKKEPSCDCGRSMSKYFEDNNDLHNP